MGKKSIRGLLFDLDGTLLDTAEDLVDAINIVLNQHGRNPVENAEFRWEVYGGSKTMLCHGFQINENDELYSVVHREFLQTYRDRLTNKTQFFPGIVDVLDYLDEFHLPWGIVTNKPGWLASPLLAHFQLDQRSKCIVMGDTLDKCKPDPRPLLHACETMRISPKQTLFLGDTEIDIHAAKAAGTYSIVAAYGYQQRHNNPEKWQADHIIYHAKDMIPWLKENM